MNVLKFFANAVTDVTVGGFINECGHTTNKFKYLTKDGKNKYAFLLVFLILVFIGMLGSYIKGYGKSKEKDEEEKKDTAKKIFKVLFWLFLIVFILLTGFSIFMYNMFSKEHSKWLEKLEKKNPNCYDMYYKLQDIEMINNLLKKRKPYK